MKAYKTSYKPTHRIERQLVEPTCSRPATHKVKGQVNILLPHTRRPLRNALLTSTRNKPQTHLIGDLEEGEHWAKLIPHINLHILLFDLDVTVPEGRVWTKWVAKHFPQVTIIALVNSTTPGMASYLFKQGFDGVIDKNDSSDQILQQALLIRNGNGPFSQLKTIYPSLERTTKAFHKRLEWLNSTELEILRLVCLDYTAAEIAQHLPYSPRSIEGKKAKIQSKLGVRGVAGMVAHAVNNGLLYEEPTQTFR